MPVQYSLLHRFGNLSHAPSDDVNAGTSVEEVRLKALPRRNLKFQVQHDCMSNSGCLSDSSTSLDQQLLRSTSTANRKTVFWRLVGMRSQAEVMQGTGCEEQAVVIPVASIQADEAAP